MPKVSKLPKAGIGHGEVISNCEFRIANLGIEELRILLHSVGRASVPTDKSNTSNVAQRT